MGDRVSQLTAEVQRLSRSLEQVERRVTELEGALALAGSRLGPTPHHGLPPAEDAHQPAAVVSEQGFYGHVALAGRTLVIMGGAYLLRALTEAQVLPGRVGVGLGVLYAAAWLVAAARSRPAPDAAYHAAAATLIVLPIAWEASFKFQIVSPAAGAAMLGLFAAAGLFVAVRQRLESIAWIVAVGVSLAAVALGVATRGFVSHTMLLIAIGIATVWLGYVCDWVLLRWPVTVLASAMVAGVTLRGAAGQEPLAAFILQVLFFGLYLGSFALRTLFLRRAVIPFEVAQSICAIVVGFGGAIYVMVSTGASVGTLGLLALAFGAAAYAVAFAFVEHRCPPRNFFFYASLALTFVLAGATLTFGPTGASAVFSVLGVTAAAGARRFSRLTLTLHCTVYLLAAAGLSGLAAVSGAALFSSSPQALQPPRLTQIVVLAAIALAALVPPRVARDAAVHHDIPRCVLFTLFVATVAGVLVALSAHSTGMDNAWIAATRTVVLVAAAMLLARGGATGPLADGLWMVYPLLGIVAVKLLAEDLPRGRPATLMVAVAAYGAALIIGPKLLRDRR